MKIEIIVKFCFSGQHKVFLLYIAIFMGILFHFTCKIRALMYALCVIIEYLSSAKVPEYDRSTV